MAIADRLKWDHTYLQREGDSYPPPDPLLLEFTPPPPVSGFNRQALDVAAGMGQNGLWLASQGYSVDLMDTSRVGLLRAQTEATRRGIRSVNLLQVDLDETALNNETYALVCVFRYLKRDLMKQIRACVRPGGRIIYQTFNTRYQDVRPDMNPDYLLRPGELGGYFADWKILHNADERYISQLVALKK
ncbi:MAG: methyltransferase domain-containing protein [Burkholderiales bacterium]|nr:methyltransferase domain-containing protein [Anaerolineae bacterium]